ncbi:MAG: multidrug efflux RND transporter permease subunit [Pirellulales bacterium]
MFSRFFIDRPIFATVLSVVVTLAGAIALFALPVTQYPEIAPPTVEVSTTYAGANSQVVADTVAAPIEQQVNGVEGMMYMSSQSTNDGNYVLNVTFRPGTDLNLAQVLVQNRVALAQPILPDLVKRRGVTVKKKSPSVLMIVNLYSPDGSRDNLYLSNYATIQLRDELSRLPGVGDISFLGQRDYSLRVWIDPQQLAMRNLTTQDVVRAIEQQNIQVAAGQIGQPPAPNGQMFQYAMTTVGRLSDPEEFGNIVLSTDAEGRLVRLRDVAVSELGARVYDQVCTLDGQPSVALSIYQLPGSNALDTANNVRQKMEELRDRFPEGLDYSIVYDTTPFIRESVSEVFKALRDAVILVAIVVLVFLQGWRAALIPLVAVPVAIVGTFAAMVAVGFSLNTLTLFGLVLAVGIVVDDAIVVVEAVEHHIEHGMAPREAAIRAMDEVAGPVIAVGLVLTAVFIPCAFITGVVGQFFRQFAVTIAISTIISAFNSLTLSPALAVLFLKPRASGHGEALPRVGLMLAFAVGAALFIPQPWQAWLEARLPAAPLELFSMGRLAAGVAGLGVGWAASRVVNYLLLLAFRLFHGAFQLFTDAYVLLVRWSLRLSLVVLAIYGGLLYETYDLFQTTPSGFIPTQDKGYLVVNVQLPDGASLERTEQLMKKMELQAGEVAGVNHTVTLAGQSLLLGSTAPNFGSMYVMLDEFHDRSVDGRSADAIAADLQKMFDATVEGAEVNILGAPPIDGLGTAGGFKIVIEDRTGQGLGALEEASQRIIEEGQERPELKGLFTNFRANTTWLLIDIDRDATQSLGISLADVFHALQVNLGSLYVNDFNRFGRTWQVNVQADSQFRRQADDLKRMFVRTSHGRSVPLSTLARVREVTGPLMLVRYNLYQSAFVNGDAAPGSSSGDALRTLEAIANEQAQPTLRAEWTELAFLQQTAGSTAMFAFVLAVVLVFLVLAAQYESWSLPLAVILVVPLCLLCSIVGVRIAKMDVNIFTQVGFVVLVGLACKNAILIVEFARARHVAGVDRWTATLEACRLRLRPIIMTSLAFIFGVVPLLVGVGAGAEMRRTLGAAVFAGMLGVTVFGIFLTPVFYYVIQTVVDWRTARRGVAAPTKAS